ncbi:DNA glycosylase AlkZ-like family protein [Cellulomonas sp. URHB0016]
MLSLTWSQALAWRLRRHLLDPVGARSTADVVRTLGAVTAQHEAATELAVRTRRRDSTAGEVARALAEGELIKTFAFRGATHLMTPEDGGAYLALRASSRMWELPSWQTYYRLAPTDWPTLRQAVRDALSDGPRTRDELGAALTADPRFEHLAHTLAAGAWTWLKPLAWQGDLSFGPTRDGRATLQRLDHNPRWRGLPDVDTAGARAVEAYLTAYGPTTPAHVHRWLGDGLGAARAAVRRWLDDLGDRAARIDVEGVELLVLREDLDELATTEPSSSVRLLPRYDQWVLGPGTADPHLVPPEHRAAVSRGANVVLVGGSVQGTWSVTGHEVAITWFGAPPSREAVELETDRLAKALDAPLHLGDPR